MWVRATSVRPGRGDDWAPHVELVLSRDLKSRKLDRLALNEDEALQLLEELARAIRYAR